MAFQAVSVQTRSAALAAADIWTDVQQFACTPARKVLAAIAVGGGAILTVYIAGGALRANFNLLSTAFDTVVLKRKRDRKRKECKIAIDDLRDQLKNSKLSIEERDAILSLKLKELVAKLQDGSLQAKTVLLAYQYAALEAHDKTNCLVEPFIEATALAAALDAQEGPKGPLHGVPVSIKDNFFVPTYDSTLGLARLIDQPATQEAVMVTLIKELGGIPFVKTNVPQTMMSIDTSNPIFGQTTTPYDRRRTAGGSSGGEAALIACGGSPLGLGSDIGGSLRYPAHFCGITTIKCTAGRLSGQGTDSVVKGQRLIGTAQGPMAADVDGVVLAMETFLEPKLFQKDSLLPMMPFNKQMYEQKGKLRIGIYTENSMLTTSEPCRRAVRHAGEVLEAMGHEIVVINTEHENMKAAGLYISCVAADGFRSFFDATRGDIWDHTMRPNLTIASIPHIIRRNIARIFRYFNWWVGAAVLMDNLKDVGGAYEWWQLCQQIENLRVQVAADWRSLRLDAVLAPFAAPAMLCGAPMKAPGTVSFTSFYNVLNFPAGTMPVTNVTEEDERRSQDYPVTTPWQYIMKKSLVDMVGLPVGVQVVSYPWHEELCLRVMKELETGLQRQ